MPDGICPQCDGSSAFPSDAGAQPTNYRPWRISRVTGVVLLVLVANIIRFSSVVYRAQQRRIAHVNAARHEGPVARLDELTGSGRIYLVQMGPHKAPYVLDDFAQWLRSKYSLNVQVLPPMSLDETAWDSQRKQYVAELLYAQLKREHPALAENTDAYLIGFTDEDMYSVNYGWRNSFTQRDMKRAAVISAAHMQDEVWDRIRLNRDIVEGHLQARLRRILLKDVAILFWHLPENKDPTSLLHATLNPDTPTEDIYESDLNPVRTDWGRAEGEPCIFFIYSAQEGLRPVSESGYPIRACRDADDIARDDTLEVFEMDLRLGLLVDKHMDFYLPDTIPIQFRRATRDGWRGPMGFGISGSHNYDKYLQSADMRKVSIVHEDGGESELDRVPGWLSNLSLVKYVDADFSGKFFEMRWRTSPFEHFELKRFDGDIETYLPSNKPSELSYLMEYRNAQGQKLTFERDSHRRLTRLTSPNKSWLRLSYGAGDRIAEISDSQGRTVRYSYDEAGRLITVTYPSGETFYYEYDSTQHLLTFSVAPDAKTAPHLLLRNEYAHGRLAKQTFADGKTYMYSYKPIVAEPIQGAIVRTPEGKIFDLEIGEWESIVHER